MTSVAQPSTALAMPSHPLAKVEDLRETFRGLEGKANLISPVAAIDTIPALHGISLRAVMIDPTTNTYGQGPEVYRDARFCEKDEVALGGVALQKISAAAGVQIIGRLRTDDRSDPCYCEIEITLGIRDFDGTWRQVTKAREVDLRDGAPEAMKPERDKNGTKTGRLVPLDPSALADKRRHIQSLAETKAFYRALRTILQLRQKYTRAELTRPFVVPKLVPALDPSDPDQKKALIEMATGAETKLFARPQPADVTRTVRDVTPVRAQPTEATPRTEPATNGATGSEDPPPGDDFEMPDFAAAAPEVIVCGCPCGCQKELAPEIATMTQEKVGAARCRECFPARGFEYAKHQDLRGTLGLPAHPKLTAADVKAAVERAAKAAK